MTVSAIIPARFHSTRFPGKPLVSILGKSMIQHVYERVQRATHVDEVIVATDDLRILSEVESFGGKGRMTSPDHPSGTDRIAEVARELQTEIVVNVQGDEPLIHPEMIDLAVVPLLEEAGFPATTLRTPILDERDLTDPNVVKVVTDRAGFALYFSRFPIPYIRDSWRDFRAIRAVHPNPFWKHIGLYVYRRDFLLRFSEMAPTPLERLEGLEQLRILENGYRIKAIETSHASIGVDTPEDLHRVERAMRAEARRA